MNELSVLIVDDQEAIVRSSRLQLLNAGLRNILTCTDSRMVMQILENHRVEVMLLDLSMPFVSGQELLPQIREKHPEIAVIVITGNSDLNTAVRCLKDGAYDFIAKPVDQARLLTSVKIASQSVFDHRVQINLKNKLISSDLEHPHHFEKIVTQDDKLFGTMRYIEAISKTGYPVLIVGETGTGKDLFAEAIHLSSQKKGPYVQVNVNEFDQSFFLDALFGHSKGSFTGASDKRKGLIEKAEGGTLFLDEIGDLDLSQQVKLLRLIQNREYRPIGSDEVKKTNARLIFATNQNLKEMIKQGTFRKDLYFRLQTHEIGLTPLRKRKKDIAILVKFFFDKFSSEYSRELPHLDKKILDFFTSLEYEGNVRELEQMLLDTFITYPQGSDLFNHIKSSLSEKNDFYESLESDSSCDTVIFPEEMPSLKELSAMAVDEALLRSNNNKSKAARLLGITPSALSQRLSKGPPA